MEVFGFKVFEADGHNIKDIYNKISLQKNQKTISYYISYNKGKRNRVSRKQQILAF